MSEQYLLEALVYGALAYLAFRYTEGILTCQFSNHSVTLTGWLILYTAGNLIWSGALDYAHISESSVYASFLHLLPIALLLLILQNKYFHTNWPRQVFALASFIAGWAVLRFAVSPLSYVLFDYWNPFFAWFVDCSLTHGWITAEQLLAAMGFINEAALMVVLVFCRLIQLGIFALYLWLIQKYFYRQDYELSWTESLFLISPCITVLAIDVTLRVMAYSVDNSALMVIYYRVPETLLLLPLVSLLLLGMMVTAVRLFRGVVQFKEAEAKRLLLENGITDIHRQVAEMQDIYGDMRGLRHDLRGHIESLTAYVHNHLQGEQTELEHYLTQMKKTTERLDFADKTGHPITDIILHQIRQQARRHQIDFTASMELRSYAKGHLFFIEMENDFAGELNWDEDAVLPLTSKTDKKHHGIDLANIARCAEKYQGSIAVEIVPKENRQRFCLRLALSLSCFFHKQGFIPIGLGVRCQQAAGFFFDKVKIVSR